MTRQWLSPPENICIQHVLGEHAETHSFLSKMRQGHSLEGFRDGSMFFGAEYVQRRHDLLAATLKGHSTPLHLTDKMKEFYPLVLPTEEDVHKSILDLINRCDYCRDKHGFIVVN